MNKNQKNINRTSRILTDRCWLRLEELGFYNGYDYSENGLFNKCRKIIRLGTRDLNEIGVINLKNEVSDNFSIPTIDTIINVYIETGY